MPDRFNHQCSLPLLYTPYILHIYLCLCVVHSIDVAKSLEVSLEEMSIRDVANTLQDVEDIQLSKIISESSRSSPIPGTANHNDPY